MPSFRTGFRAGLVQGFFAEDFSMGEVTTPYCPNLIFGNVLCLHKSKGEVTDFSAFTITSRFMGSKNTLGCA